jgi:hypothetical protein
MLIMPQQMLIMAQRMLTMPQTMAQHVGGLLPPPARGNYLSNR